MAATRNPLFRLHHIRDEINDITAALQGIDQASFKENYILLRAAERALLIISEAAKALPEDVLRRHPEIDWLGILRLGNVLRHEYHMVDPDTLWEILTSKLPELAPVVAELIRELG
jgi:uncharacterized protein with HEPN domain